MVSRSPSEFISISGWRTETNSVSMAIMVPGPGCSWVGSRGWYVFGPRLVLSYINTYIKSSMREGRTRCPCKVRKCQGLSSTNHQCDC